MRLFEIIFDVFEGIEPLPMHHILLFRSAPILRQKSISTADDFCVEVRSEFWPVICKTTYPKIATKER